MDDPAPDLRGLRPGPPLAGELRAPPSKSLAQRALLCALAAHGRTRVTGLAGGEDLEAALGVLRALGALGRDDAGSLDAGTLDIGTLDIEGRGAAGLAADGPLAVGESGTLARLALGLLALAGRPGARFELRARGSLTARGAEALRAALQRAGVAFDGQGWPWSFTAVRPPDALVLEGPRSSQELSALLLGLAAHPGSRTIEVRGPLPSRPYVEMTARVLRDFGAAVACEERPEGSRWSVQGPLRAPERALALEPDASSAAVALCAAAITGGAVLARGLRADSAQGDVRIAEHLAALGCSVHWSADGLEVRGAAARSVRLDLADTPDLAPPLAAVLAAAASPRHGEFSGELLGLGTLDAKESARLEGLAVGLAAAGWRVERTGERLRIGARRDPDDATPLVLDARGDHRMAFAFALLGLTRPDLRVRGADAVAKSWPSFWDDLAALGARAAR